MEHCLFCGEPAILEISEILPATREIVLDSRCEAGLSLWLEDIRSWTRKERAQWVRLEAGLYVRDVLVGEETLSWTLDYGIHLDSIEFDDACDFVRRHHRDLDPPVGWKFGAAVFNGHALIGVMMAGRPVSAALAAQGCLEVNRVCVMDTCPRALKKDACSMLYGEACRKAFGRGYRRVISYTLKGESGVSLRAAGFVPVATTAGGTWSRTSCPREDKGSTEPKIGWERWIDGATLPRQLALPLAA